MRVFIWTLTVGLLLVAGLSACGGESDKSRALDDLLDAVVEGTAINDRATLSALLYASNLTTREFLTEAERLASKIARDGYGAYSSVVVDFAYRCARLRTVDGVECYRRLQRLYFARTESKHRAGVALMRGTAAGEYAAYSPEALRVVEHLVFGRFGLREIAGGATPKGFLRQATFANVCDYDEQEDEAERGFRGRRDRDPNALCELVNSEIGSTLPTDQDRAAFANGLGAAFPGRSPISCTVDESRAAMARAIENVENLMACLEGVQRAASGGGSEPGRPSSLLTTGSGVVYDDSVQYHENERESEHYQIGHSDGSYTHSEVNTTEYQVVATESGEVLDSAQHTQITETTYNEDGTIRSSSEQEINTGSEDLLGSYGHDSEYSASYDADGNLRQESITNQDGYTETRTYDENGNLTKVETEQENEDGSTTKSTTDYDENGNVSNESSETSEPPPPPEGGETTNPGEEGFCSHIGVEEESLNEGVVPGGGVIDPLEPDIDHPALRCIGESIAAQQQKEPTDCKSVYLCLDGVNPDCTCKNGPSGWFHEANACYVTTCLDGVCDPKTGACIPRGGGGPSVPAPGREVILDIR